MGQLSNQAAVELTQEGFGKLFCLAGIGAHLSGFVQSARDIPNLVVIDGCEIGCAKGVLEQAEVPLRGYLVITDLGIKKNKNLNLERQEVERVKQATRDYAAVSAAGPFCPLPPPKSVTIGGQALSKPSLGEISTLQIEITECACRKT